jgi:PTS system ascorbate-specific IIA component
MLIKDIIDAGHARFDGAASSWEDSIRKSCKALEEDGTVDPEYAEEIIRCIQTNGPYIVLMPGLALPHSMENSAHAKGTAIAFTKLAEPVSFDDSDPEKSASVFFTLAAVDHESHLKNMRKLWGMLTNEELVADLQKVRNLDELAALDAKYRESA